MNKIKLTLPSEIEFWRLVEALLERLYELVNFPKKEGEELKEAVKELFFNACIHAYKDEKGEVEIEVELLDNGIIVNVKDKGEPMDERVLKDMKTEGFKKINSLVDSFKYFNLGLEGKKFSVAKYVPIELKLKEDISFYSDIGEDFDDIAKEHLKERLVVREFREGDEVWIPKLIYRNYGYTYFKDLFYYPDKILKKEKSGQILSIVAEIDGKIVGHFAMVKVPKSNIAEIGIAVVDPAFKGMGIMKKMFALLIKKAKELGLSAIFGEAITFHPYSQRANARFGFCTTALMLGDIHQMVQLKDHKYPFRHKRGAVALEYKILKPFFKKIAIPKRYEKIIKETYNICHMHYEQKPSSGFGKDKIHFETNKTFNIAYIFVEDVSRDFEREFKKVFEKVISTHPDMIYADINLEDISNIDHAVEVLRNFGFFYSGMAFLRRFDKDYLRLQFEVSENIEEENIVCYSDFCKKLHRFILKDKEL